MFSRSKLDKMRKCFELETLLVNRNVFLKIYEIPASDPLSALREPHLIQQVEHQNLVRIHGADLLEDNKLLLEMEFISGGTARDMIASASESGRWPAVGTCVKLVSEFAAGLNHLHGHDYVHRDVKPANLLIAKVGSRQRGIVTDLGLASRVDTTGRALGTKHARLYRPPEVWEGSGYSVRSDLYQLGIVLFQLLGGGFDYELGNLSDDVVAPANSKRRAI